jgi:hypothetical protein
VRRFPAPSRRGKLLTMDVRMALELPAIHIQLHKSVFRPQRYRRTRALPVRRTPQQLPRVVIKLRKPHRAESAGTLWSSITSFCTSSASPIAPLPQSARP